MAFTPTTGLVAILKSGANTYPGVNWTLNYDGKATKNPSNFRDGRVTVTTLADGQLSFTLVWDSAAPPTLASGPNLRVGSAVTVNCYTDATNFFSFPGVVAVISPKNPGVEDVVMFDVTVELSGAITYPLNG